MPEHHADERYLFLPDILPTAWQAVKYADIPKGGSVVVFGLGPVGQFCTRIARYLGAETVYGVDLVPERLELARTQGVLALSEVVRQELARYPTAPLAPPDGDDDSPSPPV